MRILFEATWWVDGPIANRSVLRCIITQWRKSFPADQLILAVPQRDITKVGEERVREVEVVGTHLPVQGLVAHYEIPRLARRYRADIAVTHNFAPRRGPSAVFIHDTLFQSNPEWFTIPERVYFSGMPRTARHAGLVFTSSSTEAAHIQELNRRIRPIPVGLAVSPDLISAVPEPPTEHLPDDYLLTVGRLNLRKNLASTLEGSLRASRVSPQCPLVVVGQPSGKGVDFSPEVGDAIQSGRVRLLQGVTDPQLAWLYRNARAFVFMTLGEGFGLPPLEAATLGLPVIASDIPVMHEVLESAAIYCEPRDTTRLATLINNLLDPASHGNACGSPPSWSWQAVVEKMRGHMTEYLHGT